MDGGRRVLRSLRALLSVAPRVPLSASAVSSAAPSFRSVSLPSRSRPSRLHAFATHPATTLAFCALVLGGGTGYGMVRGGALADLVARYGAPTDVLARAVGLGIDTIAIGGLTELNEGEILAASGVSNRNSLLFLDVQDVRTRLLTLPLVRDVGVRKLYPSQVAIFIIERQPFALWQKDGQVSVVAADGKVIDTVRDDRFLQLPFVVGAGANTRLEEFAGLLAAAGDLRNRVKAGVLVADRRWDLVTTDGLTIRLPEENPADAVLRLVQYSRDVRILDKDVVAVDLRDSGRLIVQLSDDAAASRAETIARKIPSKGKA